MTFRLNANRRLIIHEGKLQMFAIEQHGGQFVLIHEITRQTHGPSHPTRKQAQDALTILGELAIRGRVPVQENPEIAAFLGR